MTHLASGVTSMRNNSRGVNIRTFYIPTTRKFKLEIVWGKAFSYLRKVADSAEQEKKRTQIMVLWGYCIGIFALISRVIVRLYDIYFGGLYRYFKAIL